MLRRRGWWAAVGAPLTAVALLSTVLGSVAVAGGEGAARAAVPRCSRRAERLPDLRQDLPRDVSVDVQKLGPHVVFRLGFTTIVANVGGGPFQLVGHRTARAAEMRAEQVVERVGAGICRYRDVGVLRFDHNRTHDHWHLQAFDRYSLTRPRGRSPVAPARKAGFCLNDDLPAPDARRPSAQRVFLGDCGLGQPQARSVDEGISAGWADVYPAYVQGQFIDITKVPAGRYVLANRVNVGHRLLEARNGNDAASLLIRLSWPHGRDQSPTVRVLAACPGKTTCQIRHRGR